MNSIDFLKYSQFPLSTETLSMLQDMINLVAKIARLGGQNYILSGCETNSYNIVSSGYLVIEGEILPFQGGYALTYVTIVEEKSSVLVYENNYQDIYITRKAVFGYGSPKYPWSSFRRIDILQLITNMTNVTNALNNHLNNHSVTWSNVTGKPSAFPPVQHVHLWNDISSKPATYPPSEHSHPGLGIFLGTFNSNGTVVYIHYGNLNVTVERLATGTYKLTHNLGHTNYIIMGVGIGSYAAVSIRSNIEITNNYCVVTTSDDSSLNDSDIRFCILSFE